MAGERVQRRLAAILAADVVGYSRLMGDDEAGTLSDLKRHHSELIRPLIAHYRGRVVKTTGDGILVEFASAVDAVLCAREIQDGMAERNAAAPRNREIELRIGVNVGDVLVDGDDILGDGVNVAARLEGICEPGGICVSGTVYDQVRGKLELGFADLGGRKVKNIAEPVRVYEVMPSGGRGEPLRDSRRIGSGARPWAAIAAVVIAAGAGYALWQTRPAPLEPAEAPVAAEPASGARTAGAPATEPLGEKPTIAVLPFTDISDGGPRSHVSEGMTADLSGGLAGISGLFVVADGSTGEFAGLDADVREAGRSLGVDHVVQGTVSRTPERLEVVVSLVDTRTGREVWGGRYDRAPADRFAMRDEIVHAVAGALGVPLAADEAARLARAPTGEAAAYDHYLRARSIEAAAADLDAIREARELYRKAIAEDPEFAGGFAGVASTHARVVSLGLSPTPEEEIAKALEFARTAVALDDTFVTGRLALGFAQAASGRLDEAITTYEETLAMEPSNATAHAGLGITLTYTGKPDAGARELDRALALDPLNFDAPYRKLLGLAHFAAGRPGEAIEVWEQDQTLRGLDRSVLAAMAAAYGALGLADKAEAAKERLLETDPEFSTGRYALLQPFRPAERERLAALLVKAGLPE